MIFCLRQLQEKCLQDRPLYMVFVDFSKAFDTVGRTGLWQLLRKYGCPEKFTTMIADDSALVAHSAEEMQKIVDAFTDASKKFGLKINIKKTEVLYQSNSTGTLEEDIMVDGNKLNSVLEFTYLGSTI